VLWWSDTRRHGKASVTFTLAAPGKLTVDWYAEVEAGGEACLRLDGEVVPGTRRQALGDAEVGDDETIIKAGAGEHVLVVDVEPVAGRTHIRADLQ